MLLCPGPIPKTAHSLPHLVLMHHLPSGDRGYAPKFIADSSLTVRVPICAGAVLLSLWQPLPRGSAPAALDRGYALFPSFAYARRALQNLNYAAGVPLTMVC
jgi:hypothetical protein